MTLPRFTRVQWLAGLVLLFAMLAMFANETRLEHARPSVPMPANGFVQPVHFKNASGHMSTMFISGRDQAGRLGIAAVFLGMLGVNVWLRRRGLSFKPP